MKKLVSAHVLSMYLYKTDICYNTMKAYMEMSLRAIWDLPVFFFLNGNTLFILGEIGFPDSCSILEIKNPNTFIET